MMQMLNCRLRVTLTDGRTMLGQLLAYDKHMNLILADTEEFRPVRKSKDGTNELRRTLGLAVLRGECIVSMTPEGGPPLASGNKARVPAAMQMGPGGTRGGLGRGVPMPPPGMAPVGLAGPAPAMYARPPPGVAYLPPPPPPQ